MSIEHHQTGCKFGSDCRCEEPQPKYGNLTGFELERLARYNGECGRGIMHTREYILRMKDFQDRFNGRER